MAPDDVFVIETPGGGGFGAPAGVPAGSAPARSHKP
jgi:N-methylhydantoinase B/oxoprolinase/acetone carboxylase alpha subunit